MLAFSPLLTAFITRYGWRNALRIISGGILVVGIANCSLLSDPPSKEDYEAVPRKTSNENHDLEAMNQAAPVSNDKCAEENSDVTRAPKHGRKEKAQAPTNRCGRLYSFVKDVEAWAWCISVTLSYIGWSFFNLNFVSFTHDFINMTL